MAADAGRRRDGRRPDADLRRRHRPGRLGRRHLVHARRVRPPPAALPRPRRHRPRVPRGPPAGLGGHHRAPRAARVPGPPGRAAGPGVHAGPPLPVPVLDRGLDLPSRLHRRPAGHHRPGPDPARRLRRADRADRLVAPAAGTRGRGARRRPQPPRPPPLRARHDRRARQGGPRHGQRQPADRGAADVVGAVVRAGGPRPLEERGVADAGLVGVRGRLRRGDRARGVRARRVGRRRPAGPGGRQPPLGVRRGRRRRARVPPGDLARLVAAAGLAGGLRGLLRAGRRPARAGAPGRRHPLRARLVPLPGDRPPRPRGRRPHPARRQRGRRRRRERGREDDPGQAAVPDVRADQLAASSWTAPTWPGSRTTRGAGTWPAPCRTSSASSSPPP